MAESILYRNFPRNTISPPRGSDRSRLRRSRRSGSRQQGRRYRIITTISKLSPRLQAAYQLVPEKASVIDVGADRGYLSLALSSTHRVVSIENKKGPYELLVNHLKEYQDRKIECVLADGLDYLPKDIDTACILGMGGTTIFEILSKDERKLDQLKYIIIEPQSNFSEPISYLLRHGFINDEGCYVFEKHYYPLLRFVKGKDNPTPLEEKYGPVPVRRKDLLLLKMLEKQIHILTPYLSQASTKEKYLQLLKEYQEIQDEITDTAYKTR